MILAYIIISAALVPILDNFFNILHNPHSWWTAPLLFIGFFLGFIIIQLLALVLMVQFTNLNKSPDKGHKFFRFLVKNSLPIILKVARVEINSSGLDKLPSSGRMLFVCNHQHDFDPVIILSAFPDSDIGFIGKKEIYQTMPFIGKAMHRLYSLPIDRENDREAAKTIIKAINIIKEDKASIALFPEGYTSRSCELLPFRNGSFKIATKAKVPIVVCVINNTRRIPKNIFRRKTVIDLKLLDVVYPEQFEALNTVALGDMIHAKMLEALTELRKNSK